MLLHPFSLDADMGLMEAMRQTLNRHFPSYPVCDEHGVLVGIVRGSRIFEEEAIEISAQAGRMVGVEKEEHAGTPFAISLRSRHPWLQFNLLTAFAAAAVVGTFEDTIARLTVLAVFLPVLAGQSGNTGCQAMAVALRGLTLGELKPGQGYGFLLKEAALGLANGALVGITAGAAMYAYASWQGSEGSPVELGAIVFLAMTGSCLLSGVSGVMVPLTLKRLGFDAATASGIFLTTATDVASMGFLLGLATLWL
jgi:magnesium transporter